MKSNPTFLLLIGVIISISNTGCVGVLARGALSRSLLAPASRSAIGGTATIARGLSAAGQGVRVSSHTIRGLATGTLDSISVLRMLNVLSETRRVKRLGLTAPFIEEHCMIRAGSQLTLAAKETSFAVGTATRLLGSNGNLLATVGKVGNKVVIKDPSGRVVSSSVKTGDRITHFADAEHTQPYAYTVVEKEKRTLTHYMLDALDASVELGAEQILESLADQALPSEFVLSPDMLRDLEASYPPELFESELQDATDRLSMPLMIDPRPPRDKNFTVERGLVKNGNLQFEITGFTINAGYEATVTAKISNLGDTARRIGINAVGEQGFRAPPYIYAKLIDSSGFRFYCGSADGLYWQAKLIGMDDSQYLIREQASLYDPAAVQRWLSSMDRLDPKTDHLIVLKFKMPRDAVGRPDLDLNFNLSLNLYEAVERDSTFEKVTPMNVDFSGIVPLPSKESSEP
jgi:hypothetical protein